MGDFMRVMIERDQQMLPELGGMFLGMGGLDWC